MAQRWRRPDGRQPPRIRRQRLGHAAWARARAYVCRSRSRGVGVNFHTSHRAVVGFAFFGYLALTLLIAILPAASVQGTPGLPGVAARGPLAEQGRAIYLREGGGCGHTQCVRDLPIDRPYGQATEAAR